MTAFSLERRNRRATQPRSRAPALAIPDPGPGDCLCHAPEADTAERLLRHELLHRSSNDLQLIISIMSLQAHNASHSEARAELARATARITILARARADLHRSRPPDLARSLGDVCEALASQAEPRGIAVRLRQSGPTPTLPEDTVLALALAVNELVTNALKHAFPDGRTGEVRVELANRAAGPAITVSDDGEPFPQQPSAGSGLALITGLVRRVGGSLLVPPQGSKRFVIRLPKPGLS